MRIDQYGDCSDFQSLARDGKPWQMGNHLCRSWVNKPVRKPKVQILFSQQDNHPKESSSGSILCRIIRRWMRRTSVARLSALRQCLRGRLSNRPYWLLLNTANELACVGASGKYQL